MNPNQQKGSFGNDLPVSGKYITPQSRKPMLVFGGLAMLAVLAYAGIDFYMGKGTFMSNGPLSTSHAGFESDCASCHDVGESVTVANCVLCHERDGDDLGIYSFDAHYVYRSDDFQRVSTQDNEMPCSSCHPEHEGRDGHLTQVPNQRCASCHDGHSFNTQHPEFEALAIADDGGLDFPHVKHVRELMTQHGFEDVEQACLQCHEPQPDGRYFKPLDFDRNCDSCHLTTSVGTARLPIGTRDRIGVDTLETIQQKREPGSSWAFFMNPGEFRVTGKRLVSKTPLHHKDPWVLNNLRKLRKQMYGDAGLADLIAAGVDVPDNEVRDLYREAINTLETYALELRSRPEDTVQDELTQINQALTAVKSELDDPYGLLNETELLLALDGQPIVDATQAEEIQAVAEDLAKPCLSCHQMENLTLSRVRQDQRTYHRAEFNHKTHTIQRRCLDCHNQFPQGAFDAGFEADVEMPASVQNLPGIDTCRECHNQETSSNDCVTCHNFHPDQNRRSYLLPHLK